MTRTLAQLAADLRIGDGVTEPTGVVLEVLSRISEAATAMVLAVAPGAPDAIHNEAYSRLATWLYDSDPSGTTPGGPAALRASGAGSILNPYRVRRGGLVR